MAGIMIGYARSLIKSLTSLEDSSIVVAGPMADIAFSFGQLMTIAMLKNVLPSPVSFIISGGAILNLVGELFLIICSVGKKDDVFDFSKIFCNGSKHFIAATTAVVAEVALGLFGTFTLFR